jgi:hypothetical protein
MSKFELILSNLGHKLSNTGLNKSKNYLFLLTIAVIMKYNFKLKIMRMKIGTNGGDFEKKQGKK